MLKQRKFSSKSALIASLSLVGLATATGAVAGEQKHAAKGAPVALAKKKKKRAHYHAGVRPARVVVNKQGTATVTVHAGKGMYVNGKFPRSVEVGRHASALSFSKTKFKGTISGKGKDVLTVTIPVTSSQAGDHEATLKVKFAVCTKTQCFQKRIRLKMPVHATNG